MKVSSRRFKVIMLVQLIFIIYLFSRSMLLLFAPKDPARFFAMEVNGGKYWQGLARNGSYIGNGTDWKRVAIGSAITSVGITGLTRENFQEKWSFFEHFFPSFCSTASAGYSYPIYLAFDATDPVFTNMDWVQLFYETFVQMTAKLRCNGVFKTSLHLVRCAHDRRPAWAQNDAMMEAYIDGATFFYRVNDDTKLTTSGWTERFIEELAAFEPPFVGVVGPKHTGGNTGILTYDFVHRNHIDIFGFYYPRAFTGWFSDNWMTEVYKSSGRMKKLWNVQLDHLLCCDMRYPKHSEKGELLKDELEKGAVVIDRFISWLKGRNSQGPAQSNKAICLSLDDTTSPDVIFGSMQNARLAAIFFPGWKVRIYLREQESQSEGEPLPPRIINCLETLNVEVMYTNISSLLRQSELCHLVASDLNVDYFMVRSATARLSERDAYAVSDWINSQKAIHTIRDHFSHRHASVVNTLWGGMPHDINKILHGKSPPGSTFAERLLEYVTKRAKKKSRHFDILLQGAPLETAGDDRQLVENVLMPYLGNYSFCHDSITCHDLGDVCHRFPVDRAEQEYLGQSFQAMGIPYVVETEHSNEQLPSNCHRDKPNH